MRRFIRFLQFKISDSYISALTTPDAKLQDYLRLSVTRWFDLGAKSGRRNAIDNIVALLHHQTYLMDADEDE